MGKVLKGPTGGGQPIGGRSSGGGLGDLLGSLVSGGGLGSILGAGVGAGAGSQTGGGMGSVLGGGLGALIPTLLPALLGMLGGKGSATQTGQTGMHQLVANMNANGLGEVAQSWVGAGPNKAIAPDQVQQVLTPDQLAELSAKSGLPQDQVNSTVADILPKVVNHLTPDGTLPEAAQIQSATDQLQQSLAGITGGQA
jgi:uncharacterized protein YidB (DUF937 family)